MELVINNKVKVSFIASLLSMRLQYNKDNRQLMHDRLLNLLDYSLTVVHRNDRIM